MENWQEGKIKDFADVKGGKRLPKGKQLITEPNSHPYIRIRDLGKAKILELTSDYEYVDDETQESIARYIVDEGDILISVVGTVGLVGIVGNSLHKANQTENCDKIINLRGINRDYLYYYLVSPVGQEEIKKGTVGAVQPKLPLKNVQDITIKYPSLETQKKIAELLSSIDNKIENNNKINRNLEQQVDALYKSWFLDYEPFGCNRPSDWIEGTVDDLATEIICGKTPSTKNDAYYGDDIPFITIPDMHNSTYIVQTERKLSFEGAESQIKKSLPKNSICVSCIGTAGLVSIVSETSHTNQQINSIIPKVGYSPFYIFLLMKSLYELINALGQSGSTIVNLNKTQFGKITVQIPSTEVMQDFDELVTPIFDSILSNQKENIQLSTLRDILLPKLMSGEIDVTAIEI